MTDIARLTRLLLQCVEIQRLAEDREESLHALNIAEPDNADIQAQIKLTDSVYSDAMFLRGGFEAELCAHIAASPAEVLVQILVVNEVVRSHELTGDADTTVRLMLQNIIQGLVRLCATDDVVLKLLPTYYHPGWDAWQDRFEAFKQSGTPNAAAA